MEDKEYKESSTECKDYIDAYLIHYGPNYIIKSVEHITYPDVSNRQYSIRSVKFSWAACGSKYPSMHVASYPITIYDTIKDMIASVQPYSTLDGKKVYYQLVQQSIQLMQGFPVTDPFDRFQVASEYLDMMEFINECGNHTPEVNE